MEEKRSLIKMIGKIYEMYSKKKIMEIYEMYSKKKIMEIYEMYYVFIIGR